MFINLFFKKTLFYLKKFIKEIQILYFMEDTNKLITERINKINELNSWGIDSYPQHHKIKNYSEEIKAFYDKFEKKEVEVAGRIITKREMGKASFFTISDSKGTIQIYGTKDNLTDSYKLLKKTDIGDIVKIKGKIFKTKTEEITIEAKEINLLCKSIRPLPEKYHGLKDVEERYRKRYIDLISNPGVLEVFKKRSIIIDEIRNYLKENSFIEVETPTLQTIYGGASASPFTTHLNALNIDLFLSISPELYLKRLLVGGFDKVFTICKNFRNEGIDKTHNPEFTMLEFYYAYTNFETLIEMTEELITRLKNKLKLPDEISYQGKSINLKTPFKRVTFRDLILNELGIDINITNDFKKLKKEIESRNIKNVNIDECLHYGALLDELYKRVVRPSIVQPTFLTHYPVEMIALAKRNKEDPTKINTVQLLIDGAEIIKAYDELNDPQDQKKRLNEQQKLLKKGDDDAMPMDMDFIEALEIGMPPTAGYGLGIDRLVMILTNQASIRDVILFPFMKPQKD